LITTDLKSKIPDKSPTSIDNCHYPVTTAKKNLLTFFNKSTQIYYVTLKKCNFFRLLNHGIPLTMGMIASVQTQFDRAGHKRGRQVNILADKKLYEFCELRNFELQFTGEKLKCVTQAEKARQMAAKTQAKQKDAARASTSANTTTYGQWRQQGPSYHGKRPRN
jgi:hypothetical protein